MTDELCKEKHKQVDETLNLHNTRLNDHSKRIDNLEKSDAVNTTLISQLIKRLDGLITSMWALVIVLAGAFVGFFFYAIQSHVFK